VALIALWSVLVFTRSDVEATILRAPGALFQQMPGGRFSNLYTLKVVNKTSHPVPVLLTLDKPTGSLQVLGNDLVVPSENLLQASVLIELDKNQMLSGKTPLVIGVYSKDRRLESLKTSFIGPRDDTNTTN
jgi:hypothetical protein